MFKKIKQLALTIGVFSLLVTPVMAVATVSADIQGDVTCGTNLTVTSGQSCDATNAGAGDNTNIDSILRLAVNIFSAIVGFIAVIMIIVGGVKYITSGGDSGNISGAKNTIIFALVGLVIVALAQVIVHFVLQKVATAGSTS